MSAIPTEGSDTARLREAALREILGVISQSRDDDKPVFDVIVQSAARLCNAPMAWLLLTDADQSGMVLAGYHGLNRRKIALGDHWPLNREPDTITGVGRAILGLRTVQEEDLAQTAHYLNGTSDMRLLVDDEGVRTRLSVPLVSGGKGIGAIILSRRDVALFGPDETGLVETFAAQAVIAIENVRQFGELQTRLAREAASAEILEVISQSRDDDRPVFDVVLRKAAELCHASMAGLNIRSEDGSHAVMVAEWGDHVTDLRPVGETAWPMESDHAPSKCIREGRIVHVHDLKDTDLYRSGDPIRVTAADVEGIRTFLAVPLSSGGRTISCITIYRREVRPFTPDEIALVETFAAQAVIAIENVRQFRELQDSLEQQQATSDILRVISQSREDETQVFDLILEKAAVLCDADQGSLMIVNEARTHVRHMADWGHEHTAYHPGLEYSLDLRLSIVPTIRTAKVVHIEDYSQSAAYRERDPIAVDLVETEGHRTRLIVPLLQGGIAIGCIALGRRTVRPFAPDEIALVETFAAQAVIAIENVRQFRELQTRLAREAATREILEVISQSRDDDAPVFEVIAQNAARLCGAAVCSFWRVEDGLMHYSASHGLTGEVLAEAQAIVATPLFDNTVTGQVVKTRAVVRIEDATAESYYNHEWVRARGLKQFVGVPIFVRDEVWGSITLMWPADRAPQDADITLVESFAAQASIAIENVRQFRELQTRLAREAATREILEVISNSRDDEQPVFDVILQNMARLCATSLVTLSRVNPEGTELAYVARHGDALSAFELGHERWPLDSPIQLVRSVREGRVLHTPDLVDSDLYRAGNPVRVRMVDQSGFRSFLTVPLITPDGRAIGCIALCRKEVRPFTPSEIALVETFAAQAVIAIENVRQFRELQTRLAREAATREILEVISQSRDDDKPVFDVVLRKAAELCHAPLSSLNIISEDRSHAVHVAEWGFDYVSDVFPVGKTIVPLDAQYATSTCMREGRVVQLEDMADTDLYRSGDPLRTSMVDQEGMRTFLAVPLFSGGQTIGCILLFRLEVRPFTPDEIALVETFAAQAVIAIENVRQFRELQVRLAREAATREILEVISQSRDDDKPVFDVVLRKAAELCHASMADLNILSEDRTHAVLTADWGDIHSDKLPVGTVWPMDSDRGPQISLRDGRIRHVHDLADTDAYRSGDRVPVIAVEEIGIRTVLTVPLFSAGQTVACISIYRREVRPFTADEIALVETFAAQAVIAIENVRQFRELQDRLAREEATRQILQVISQSRDDETPVFDAILDRAERLCDAGSSALLLVDEARSHLVLAATRGMRSSADIGETQPLTSGHTSSDAILTGAVVQVLDVRDTELYRNGDPLRVELVDKWGLRTSMAVPLMQDGVAIGAFTVMRLHKARAFSDNDIRLLEAFAAQAVIAIENVRQFRALEALNAELGERVQDQVGQIERMGRLKRFLPAAVADAVVSSGSERMLSSHRALLGVLFCDIRGFTAFCETAEPEETIEVLQTYHEEMGRLIEAHGAGVDHRMGDGIMVLFNDPIPCDDPAGSAVRLGMAMRDRMAELCAKWKKIGHRLGFGVGISLGYATVGMVGSGGRQDYTASGTAVNLAARLCDEAGDGEILVSPRAATAIEGSFAVAGRGERSLKGIREPVELLAVTAMPIP